MLSSLWAEGKEGEILDPVLLAYINFVLSNKQ